MKMSNNVATVVVTACILIAIVVYENGDKIFGSEAVNLVDIEAVNHSVYGNGYQIIDKVEYRICVVYPDAEPLNRLNCSKFEELVDEIRGSIDMR